MAGKSDLLVVGDILVAKHQHPVFIHPRFDRGDVFSVERPAANDTRDFADEDRVDLTDRDGHMTLALRCPSAETQSHKCRLA